MGKKVYFLDSVKQSDGSYDNTYGVDDVNAIVSNLVGAGIAPFPSGNTYDVSELNSLTSALVAEGSSLDGLKVSFADNKIHIAQGIGYFANGATIVVDGNGEELDYNVAETLYVYAQYNQALNTCGFYTSESEPVSSTGVYVLILATISVDGTVTDKRVFARSKVGTLGRNMFYSIYENTALESGNVYKELPKNRKTYWEITVDIARYNYLVCTIVNELNGVNRPETNNAEYGKRSVESLLSGEPVKLTYASGSTINLYAKYEGGKLSIYREESSSNLKLYGGSEIYLC